MSLSNDEVAVINEAVGISTETTLEDILFFNFDSFGAFGDFMADLGAVVANVVSWFVLEKILVQNFGLFEVFLNKNFRMVIRAFPSFLAVPIHVVPAKLSDDVLIFA
jgi:hypothetical protein